MQAETKRRCGETSSAPLQWLTDAVSVAVQVGPGPPWTRRQRDSRLLRTGLVACGCGEAWILAHADEVGHDAEGTGNTIGHLTEEGIGHVDVGTLAVAGVEEAAFLGILIGVMHLGEGNVFGVPLAHEAVPTLFDPVLEVGGGDL